MFEKLVQLLNINHAFLNLCLADHPEQVRGVESKEMVAILFRFQVVNPFRRLHAVRDRPRFFCLPYRCFQS